MNVSLGEAEVTMFPEKGMKNGFKQNKVLPGWNAEIILLLTILPLLEDDLAQDE